MGQLQRIDRRLFLQQLGRRTAGVVVMGTGLVACSSSSDGESVTQTSVRVTTTRQGTVSTTTTTEVLDDGTTTTTEPGEQLRWSVASFDFVSAYVLARGDTVTIVDTGVSGSAARFDDALGALSVGWTDVDHVVLTHLHGDHVGGLGDVLASAPDAMAYAGAADVDGISSPRPLTGLDHGDEVAGLAIIGTPGHTAGHISVYDEGTGLLVAGDALNTTAASIEGPNPRFSSDLDLANMSALALSDLTVSTVLPGHGPVVEDAGPLLDALAASLRSG